MILTDSHKQWLMDKFGKNVRFNEPMASHTSLRVGGPVDAYVTPVSPADLTALCQWIEQQQLPCMTIGNGTNLLVLDNGLPGVAVSLKQCCRDIRHSFSSNFGAQISAGAATHLNALCSYAIQNGIKGLNFALGIPGTLGGAIMMNAGTAGGCMGDIVSKLTVLSADGELSQYEKETLVFGYRHFSWASEYQAAATTLPIILEADLQLAVADKYALKSEADTLLQARARTQPLHQLSAGSFFKNPPSGLTAGELIDQAGLKGTRIGGAEISKHHANWIVNTGEATAADVVELKNLIQSTITRLYDVELEPEVQIVGT